MTERKPEKLDINFVSLYRFCPTAPPFADPPEIHYQLCSGDWFLLTKDDK